jgi:hypothetical protein
VTLSSPCRAPWRSNGRTGIHRVSGVAALIRVANFRGLGLGIISQQQSCIYSCTVQHSTLPHYSSSLDPDVAVFHGSSLVSSIEVLARLVRDWPVLSSRMNTTISPGMRSSFSTDVPRVRPGPLYYYRLELTKARNPLAGRCIQRCTVRLVVKWLPVDPSMCPQRESWLAGF